MAPLYHSLPVEIVPEIVIKNWRVYEVSSEYWKGRTKHFVGYNVTEQHGRVSSEIKKFDKKNRIATTRSGRKYILDSNRTCEIDLDAAYVFEHWCQYAKISDIKDVTEKYEKNVEVKKCRSKKSKS